MLENIGIRYGLITGLCMIILFSVLYAVNTALMFNMWLGIAMFVVLIVVMVLAARHTRNNLGGYATFAQLVAPAFAVMVVAQLLGSIYNYALYNFIDPSLTQTLRTVTSESTYEMLTMFGAPEEDIEKALDEIDKRDFSVTLSSTIFGFAGACLFGFFMAAIIALILRKKRPAYLENIADTEDLPDVIDKDLPD